MEGIVNFLSNYYFIFIAIGVFLVFALIGYLVDSKNVEVDKTTTIKVDNGTSEQVETLDSGTPDNTVETPQLIKEEEKKEPTFKK